MGWCGHGEHGGTVRFMLQKTEEEENELMLSYFFPSLFSFFFYHICQTPPQNHHLPLHSPCWSFSSLIWPSWGGNRKYTPRLKGSFHSHTHTHKLAMGDSNVNCLLTRPPLYFAHTPLEQPFGQMQIRPDREEASDSVLWYPSGWLR